MKIDWAALGMVAVVSICASVLFVVLLASGIRMVSVATLKTNQGSSGTAALIGGLRPARARRPAGAVRPLPDRAAVPLSLIDSGIC